MNSEADTRVEAQSLLSNLKVALPQLKELLATYTGSTYEDAIYRFYHQSFKVFALQRATLTIVEALRALAPERPLNATFMRIVGAGTGKNFRAEHNERWGEETRPMLEAFFHARYFLEIAVRYGQSLEQAPRMLPSGWAALLYLYNLR